MRTSLFPLVAFTAGALAAFIPSHDVQSTGLLPRASKSEECKHSPTSRHCWGKYDVDTNYYEVIPDTGRTVEYWLSAKEIPCAPDGYNRTCMAFNGTIPGPTIVANWGDKVKVHVTNDMGPNGNGTSIHWHGVRMLNNMLNDGVPGVTQCPIAPGKSMTYEFKVSQYGSSWYHSHLSMQYADGLYGGIIFNGPATADYDEDLGTLLLQDWGHKNVWEAWHEARSGRPPTLASTLLNGTNTFNCSSTPLDKQCAGKGTIGKKFEMTFEKGKKYRIRLVNVAVDAAFQFSLDGHTLKVIANDFVPINPYTTDSVEITIGQRYDIIVEANAPPAPYWIRGGFKAKCGPNLNPLDMTGILRYANTYYNATALPTNNTTVVPSTHCMDEPAASLVPRLALDVGRISDTTFESLNSTTSPDGAFLWTLNTSSLLLDWNRPTFSYLLANEPLFPTPYNVVAVNRTCPRSEKQWAVLVIQDQARAALAHPIHLHGHDVWVLAQSPTKYDGTMAGFNMKNPVRRDVATLPPGGFLAIAFELDNPGAWLVHCHIAWHASQGLSMEVVEDAGDIVMEGKSLAAFADTCGRWEGHTPVWMQEDSGI